MKFESVYLRNFPPFNNMFIEFSENVTVIAGSNGVGKSRLLNFLFDQRRLSYGIENHPVKVKNGQTDKKIIRFDANRIFPMAPIRHLGPYHQRYTLEYKSVDDGNFTNAGDLFKNWFIQMDYFAFRDWIETEASKSNFELFKTIFSKMEPSYKFLEINRNFDVIIETPTGQLAFEQTSSGFQSAFLLLFGIVFGIDYFSDGKEDVEKFDGCVLIDEIDVHLHPSWQNKIIRTLESIIPAAQIIVTTHSPHVIQGLNSNELIVLNQGNRGWTEIKKIDPSPGVYGFQGWTIEEILRDVMGLKDSISPLLSDTEKRFNESIDNEDPIGAKPYYDLLMDLLHPRNPIRKIYDMQFDSIGGHDI